MLADQITGSLSVTKPAFALSVADTPINLTWGRLICKTPHLLNDRLVVVRGYLAISGPWLRP